MITTREAGPRPVPRGGTGNTGLNRTSFDRDRKRRLDDGCLDTIKSLAGVGDLTFAIGVLVVSLGPAEPRLR